jgi:hypothetical protein
MLFLSTRTLPVGGGCSPVSIIDDQGGCPGISALLAATSGRDVLLVTHGFNVNQVDGISCLKGWSQLLELPGVTVIGMLWPGDARWVHAVDYPVEGNEAISSGNLFATYLNTTLASASSLSFASHSLGARVVLQTILGLNCSPRRLLMMAGAIDNTCLTGEYAAAAKKVQSISLLASCADDVLEWAFPAGNILGGIFTHGLPYVHTALGRQGPATPYPDPNNIHANWQLPFAWDFGHGSYLPHTPLGPPPNQFPLTVDVPAGNPPSPPPGTPPQIGPPSTMWQPAWSAAFQSTRWK